MAHFDDYGAQKRSINEDMLHKADPEIQDLLTRIRSGQARPEDADRIERHLYQDTLVPGLRNKAAYHEHQKDYGNSGTHVAIDLNSLGKINKLHTEIAGDRAIRDMGEILHRTASKYGGRAFRNGGDEFSAHFMEPEHAHRWARDFEKELEDYHKAHGPVGGTHRLGAAVGIGHDREHAGRALIEGKKKLYDQDEQGNRTPKYDFKEMPSAIHSLTHEPTPAGWQTAKDAIAAKKKKPGPGQNIQAESDHPSAAPTSLHFPGTMSVAGAPHQSVSYISAPHAYNYVQGPSLNNPLQKSDTDQHPAISGVTPVGFLTAENPRYPAQTPGGQAALVQELKSRGIPHEVTVGKYGTPEGSIITHGLGLKDLGDLGHRYGQESVLYSHGGQHALLYTNGPRKDHFYPGQGHKVSDSVPDDDYTVIPSQGKSLYLTNNLDFNTLLPMRMHGPGKHPNAYPWHEVHTRHHGDGLVKAENAQAPGGKTKTFPAVAQHFGSIQPGAQTNLKHYDYTAFEPQIDALAQKHGYEFKPMGGQHGMPDLSRDNFNTGVVHYWNPESGSGGDFGDEAYTRSWRKIHELAHALTYKDLNDKYGEGRRIGKLGYHRTPNEAKRAVEWEDMAVQKQRQLGEQIGHHIPDPVFNKERNVVLSDAVHRAIHGTFVEPSQEGFVPHAGHVPLEHALGLVDAHAASMGLGPDETLRSKAKAVVKAELIKGAMQRLASFRPQDLDPDEHESIANWQQGGGTVQRDDIPEMAPEAKMRGMHKLHALTSVRKNPKSGEREFLLHRGMSHNEHEQHVAAHVLPSRFVGTAMSSWTTNPKVAQDFADPSSSNNNLPIDAPAGHTISAWVPESAIHHIPFELGDPEGMESGNMGRNQFWKEREIIAKEGHPFPLATSQEVDSASLLHADPRDVRDRRIKALAARAGLVPPTPQEKSIMNLDAYDVGKDMPYSGDKTKS